MAQSIKERKLPGRRPKRKDAPPMGYNAAARALEVSVGHLWGVLTGKRKSKRLVARYSAYLKNLS